MKKFYHLLALLLISASASFNAHGQGYTVVFRDTFDFEAFAGPGGTPSCFYTPFAEPVGAYPYAYSQIGGSDWYGFSFFDPGYLTSWSDDAFPFTTPESWSWSSAPLTYDPPFQTKLNLNTGLVSWTFNIQMSTPQTGNFNVSDNEALVVLAGTNSRVFTFAGSLPTEGYAITMSSAPPYGPRLVKYTDALSGSVTMLPPVDIIAPTAPTGVVSPTDYLSVRVTYDPTSNRWQLFVRDDGPFAFTDPGAGPYTLVGTAIDNSLTAVTMSSFGFYSHFDNTASAGVANYAYFDNYTVIVTCALPIQGNPYVCEGSTTTLSDATVGGTWSSLATSVATVDPFGVVTGIAPGTAIIRYTTSPTCWADTTVTVNPLPTITGPLVACVNQTINIAATPTGGTWASGTGSVGTIDATTGAFTGISGGTSTVSYTDLNGCVNTADATVNALPAAITGTYSVCAGGATTTLASTTSPGSWSTTSGIISLSSTGVVTSLGLASGTATITYTASSTGCYRTAEVTVVALPSIGPALPRVCVNATVNMTSPSGGGTWASAPTTIGTVNSSTGVAGGIASGTATISYTATTGCTNTTVLTVDPLPSLSTGNTTVCVGSTTTLSNSTTGGGTWSSTPTTTGTVGALNGVVGGISSGTFTVNFTSTTTGCRRPMVMTVNPLPAPFTGSQQVCVGFNTTLTSATAGGVWSSSNTANGTVAAGATANQGVVTGIAAGTTTIVYSLTATGCTRSAVVSVNPVPSAITGTTGVCVGYNSTLSSTPTGGTWMSNFPARVSVGSSSGVIGGVAVGTATITYTAPTTGCYTTIVASTNVTPVPVISNIGDTMICPGGFVILAGNTGVGWTYQWYESGTAIAGATSSTYNTGAAGNYQVNISNGIGCAAMSPVKIVSLNPVTATITTTATVMTVCANGTMGFTGNTGTGYTYQWFVRTGGVITPMAASSSYTFAPAAAGIDTIVLMVTNSAGCSARDSMVVTVNGLPATSVTASGPLVFCQGGNVTLSAASAIGNTYQWYNSGTPIAGATNATYSATSSGTYSAVITITATGCNRASTATNVTVNALPSAAISHATPNVFCPGGSVTLSAVAGVGLQYQWFVGGVAITGATSQNYVATATGNYRVRVTNTVTGCVNLTGADTTVTALNAATIVPLTPPEFCWGGDAMLTTSASSLPYVTFQWYLNGSPIPGANTGSYLATLPGVYTVRIVPPGACTVTTPGVVVVENPLPNPMITYNVVTGLMYTYNYYTAYQWYRNGGVIVGATTSSIYPGGNGDYKVAVTDTNGCESVSAIYQLKNWIGTNGVTAVANANDVTIYPNPAASNINVSAGEPVRLTVSSVDGKLVLDGGITTSLDISRLADGVYMVSVFNADGKKLKTEKLVKRSN